MPKTNIIRAWKDEEYRQGLSDAERALLPTNPAGMIELSDDDLGYVSGGNLEERTSSGWTLGCCTYVNNGCGASWKLGTYGCCPMSYDGTCYGMLE